MNNLPSSAALASHDVMSRANGHGLGIFAAREFEPDEVILVFDAIFVTAPDKYTIQVDEAKHLDTQSHIGVLLSHSCAANTRFCEKQLGVFAIAPVKMGEELTFNYLYTEWDLAAPFHCRCGSKLCHGTINGFRYLSPADQRTIGPHALPYLKRRIEYPVVQR